MASRVKLDVVATGIPDPGARMPALLGFAGDPGPLLRSAKVVVVGAGSIGQHLVDRCARQGVAVLQVVDPGRVEPENLLTHPLLPADVGRAKAGVAAERARALAPRTRVLAFEGPFEELPPDALVGASSVLLASDNLACEVSVAGRCLALGIPLVQAAVYGRALVAQVRCLTHADPAGPCLACAFTAQEWKDLDAGTVFSCASADARVPAPLRGGGPPTMAPPELCALAADLAVLEATRRRLGVGSGDDVLVEYCGYEPRLTRSPLRRRPACPLEHARTVHTTPAGPLPAVRLRELVVEGTRSLVVHGHVFARHALCGCDDHPRLERFFARAEALPPCERCGAPLHPHPFATDHEVPVARLARHLDRTLAELGAREAATATARGGAGSVLYSNVPPLSAAPDPEGGNS